MRSLPERKRDRHAIQRLRVRIHKNRDPAGCRRGAPRKASQGRGRTGRVALRGLARTTLMVVACLGAVVVSAWVLVVLLGLTTFGEIVAYGLGVVAVAITVAAFSSWHKRGWQR